MPTVPEAVDSSVLWSDILTNRITAAVFLVLLLLSLRYLLEILPSIGNCFNLKHGHLHLEHNRTLARSRNQVAWLLSVPFAMMWDCFGILRPDFFSLIPPPLSLPATYVMLLMYAAIHSILYATVPTEVRGEEKAAASNAIYVYLIPLVFAMLATCVISGLTGVPDSIVKTILIVEISVAFFVSLVKTGQIFSGSCGFFSTILYLCALEIVPAALIVASAILF